MGALHIACRGEVLRQLWVQGRGWQRPFRKLIVFDFKPHGVVLTTVTCQGLCYDTFWKQFDDVLTCLPKVCCLCTIIINHTAHTVIALLDTRHWKCVLHSLYSWTFLHLENWKSKHTQGQWFPSDNTVKLRSRIRFESRMSVTARTWNYSVNLSIHYQCLNKPGYCVQKMTCYMHLHIPPLTPKKKRETSLTFPHIWTCRAAQMLTFSACRTYGKSGSNLRIRLFCICMFLLLYSHLSSIWSVCFLVVQGAYQHGLSVTIVWRCDLLSVFVWWLKMENMCVKLKIF
jgi:hypothetical protein